MSIQFAHFHKARGGGYELTLTADCTLRTIVKVVRVAGKREARQIAAEHNATPWNF